MSLGGLAGVLYFFDFSAIAASLDNLRLTTLGLALALIVANSLLALLRFRSVLKSFGYRPKWRDIFFAFSIGQISNYLLFNVVGQSLSRATALTSAGVPFAASVMVTYWERLLAAGLLFLLSIGGALYLFLSIQIDLEAGGAYLISLLAAMAVTSGAVLWLVIHKTDFELSAAGALRQLGRLWPSIALTLAAQALMLAAYLAILGDLFLPNMTGDVVAALTIVMFSASLPISFSGWGIRELSAAKALGALGLDPAAAVAGAVAIGLLSMVALLGFGLVGTILLLRRRPGGSIAAMPVSMDGSVSRWSNVMVAGSAILCAVLLYFQIRIPLEGGEVTANAGDILALTGLGFLIFFMWSRQSLTPLPCSLVIGLCAISILLFASLLFGYARFGSNSWALVNRGFGWLIILGYVAVGASTALVPERWGRSLLLTTFVVAGASVAAIQLGLLILTLFGLSLSKDAFIIPLRGYATNSNAFAFQLIMTAACAITASRIGAFVRREAALHGILAVIAVAIYYSHSRAGMGMLIITLIMMIVFSRREQRRQAIMACGTVLAALLAALALPFIIDGLTAIARALLANKSELLVSPGVMQYLSPILERAYDAGDRWSSIVQGWQLWLQHPIFGGGLGSYIQMREEMHLPFLIIHSIPVWLLAEMGLIGFVVVAAILVKLASSAFRMLRQDDNHGWGLGLLIILTCITASGLVHDFFYQRTFWFLLGLFLATPLQRGEKTAAAADSAGNRIGGEAATSL
ncbi:MAG TPA: lysylphosphatidylglycerol synthase domain-containing protein [Ferrovibrio sp.]|uniref:lysylphosphatidylglycerol synthase domain-containing protein n=1 Tax=Ferrovibrio sp. TaxID=1917215 RepID=UPI002ED56BB1